MTEISSDRPRSFWRKLGEKPPSRWRLLANAAGVIVGLRDGEKGL